MKQPDTGEPSPPATRVSRLAALVITALVLAGCGSAAASETSIGAEIRSSSVRTAPPTDATLSTAPALDLTASADDTLEPAAAPETQYVATLDDVNSSIASHEFDESWDEERKAEWRRQTIIRGRLGLTVLLLDADRISIEDSVDIVGTFAGTDEEIVDQYLVAIHNHADQIPVEPAPGEPQRMLSDWYAQLDELGGR